MNRAAVEARGLSDADLAKELEDAERQLFTLRFQVATRQTANHRSLRETKRRIARLKTISHERELAALYGQED